jgi:cyclic pyranopterin phosphate synthase
VTGGIEAASAVGLRPIKLNVVLIPSLNDDEALDFAASTLEKDWEVRFIELMPFLPSESCARDASLSAGFVPNEQVKRWIEEHLGALQSSATKVGNGPAEYYQLPGARGRIGFISPLSGEGFCARCNRLRLTADGRLRPCLLTDREVDLKAALRGDAGDEPVRQGIRQALAIKPDSHHLSDRNRPLQRNMIEIGG